MTSSLDLTCPICGVTFPPPVGGTRKRYCSNSCRNRAATINRRRTGGDEAARARSLARWANVSAEDRKRFGQQRAVDRWGSDAPSQGAKPVAGAIPCANCGTPILNRPPNAYCSAPDCKRARNTIRMRRYQRDRRAIEQRAFVEHIDSRLIFERDKWRCHICSRKLSSEHAVPHPHAPTLDHLVPLTRGGMHERANVATACFRCNAAKGNRGGNEQLLLIG